MREICWSTAGRPPSGLMAGYYLYGAACARLPSRWHQHPGEGGEAWGLAGPAVTGDARLLLRCPAGLVGEALAALDGARLAGDRWSLRLGEGAVTALAAAPSGRYRATCALKSKNWRRTIAADLSALGLAGVSFDLLRVRKHAPRWLVDVVGALRLLACGVGGRRRQGRGFFLPV